MRKKILFLMLPILLGLLFVAISFSRFYEMKSMGETKTVIIPPHTGARALLSQLHREGVLPPVPLIALPMLFTTDRHSLKAGEYEFNTAMSPAQVIDKIVRGQVVIHKFIVPEGWNSFQVRAALVAEPLLTGEVPAAIPEGTIFPDTILFEREQSRASVIATMQTRMQEIVEKEWALRAEGLPLTSPQEAITLASIVEKETGVEAERAVVAGVFYNRLRLGMKLQSDPTVAYGIEVGQVGAPLGRALTTHDLQTDTPYNSYTRIGLPPTPICNPGLAALRATLHPAATDTLYFVATGHGGHSFAATLKEHEANVMQYRNRIKK